MREHHVMTSTVDATQPSFNDYDAERGFLSCCRDDDPNMYKVFATGLEAGITPKHFSDLACREYFTALLLADKENDYGFVGALSRLPNGFAKDIHPNFLNSVIMACDTSVSGERWIKRIIRAHKFRLLQGTALHIQDVVNTAGKMDDPAQLAAEVDARLTQLIEPDTSTMLSSEELVELTKKRIDEERERGGATLVPHLPWLKNVLDGGFRSGQLVIIAARPAVGKTTLAMNLAYHAAHKERKSAIYSLEMSADQLGKKLAAIDTGVDLAKFASGTDNQEERDELDMGLYNVGKLPLWTDDNPSHSISTIRSSAKVLNRRYGMDAVIVDYVGLLRPEDKRVPREQQVAAISRTCKLMAKELDVVVFLVCQLNREAEKVKGEPGMHNLRESGGLEQDADVVLLLHRDIGGEDPEEVSLIVAKNRFGRTGHSRDRIEFQRKCQRFVERKKTPKEPKQRETFGFTENRI